MFEDGKVVIGNAIAEAMKSPEYQNLTQQAKDEITKQADELLKDAIRQSMQAKTSEEQVKLMEETMRKHENTIRESVSKQLKKETA